MVPVPLNAMAHVCVKRRVIFVCVLVSCGQGKAAAARSQGKHKQRVWVNISLSGITITDEKTGVRKLTAFLFLQHHFFI